MRKVRESVSILLLCFFVKLLNSEYEGNYRDNEVYSYME